MDLFATQSKYDAIDSFSVKQELIQSPNTMATVVHAIIRDKYGDAAYWWDPITIALELKADFSVDPSPEVLNRWSAIQVVMTGDSFFNRIDSFFAVCNTLSGGEPFFGAFDLVTLEEIAWAITEVGMNRDMLPFSATIKNYCRLILEQNGYGKDNCPSIFDAIFEDKATLKDIRAGLISDDNSIVLKKYLADNANDIVAQFNSIPDLKHVDDELLKKGLIQALKENSNEKQVLQQNPSETGTAVGITQ